MEWRYGNAPIWGSVDTIGGSDSGRPRTVRPGKVFSAVRRTCMSRAWPTGSREEWPSSMAIETSCAGDIGLEGKTET